MNRLQQFEESSFPPTIEEVLKSIDHNAAELVRAALNGAKTCFEKDQEVYPAILALTEGVKPKVFNAAHRDDKEKAVMWSFLRLVRFMHPVAVMVNEIWYKRLEKDEKITKPASEYPDREEYAAVHIWCYDPNLPGKTRMIMILSKIERKPDRMGPWTIHHDNIDGARMEGSLIDGLPYEP